MTYHKHNLPDYPDPQVGATDRKLMQDLLQLSQLSAEAAKQAEARNADAEAALQRLQDETLAKNDQSDAVSQLQDRLDAVERNLALKADSATNATVTTINSMNKALESAVGGLFERLDAMGKRLDRMENRFAATEKKIEQRLSDESAQIVSAVRDLAGRNGDAIKALVNSIATLAHTVGAQGEFAQERFDAIDLQQSKIAGITENLVNRPEHENAALMTGLIDLVRVVTQMESQVGQAVAQGDDLKAHVGALPDLIASQAETLAKPAVERFDDL
ncbi:MAG: hypothetical protein AAFR27_13200, partial [Pseudomonadota bacterium]